MTYRLRALEASDQKVHDRALLEEMDRQRWCAWLLIAGIYGTTGPDVFICQQ